MIDLDKIREGLVVRPGDMLVVRLHDDSDEEEGRRMAAELDDMMPPGAQVCVLAGVEQIAVVRADDKSEAPRV